MKNLLSALLLLFLFPFSHSFTQEPGAYPEPEIRPELEERPRYDDRIEMHSPADRTEYPEERVNEYPDESAYPAEPVYPDDRRNEYQDDYARESYPTEEVMEERIQEPIEDQSYDYDY